MTLARWLIAGSWFLLFWLLAATVWVPAIQHQLTAAAQPFLLTLPTGYDPVLVTFEGQHAILRGRVRKPEHRAAAERALRENVRTAPTAGFGRNLNPVAAVTNQIEVVPYPPGWLMLAAQGRQARLTGAGATVFEARDAAARIRQQWLGQGGTLDGDVQIDAARFDESPEAEKTLTSVPSPRSSGGDSAQIQIARLGGVWRRLPIEAADSHLRTEVLGLGLNDADWKSLVLPAVQAARRYQQAERAREAQRQLQAKSPPPHVFLAARDHRLLLVGETATLAIKRSLLNKVITTFPDWKVVDEIRVNPRRRAEGEFGPITTALLPSEDSESTNKSLMLGLSGAGWQSIDWQVGRDARPWQKLLPEDLPPDYLARDSTVAIEWLQGEFRGIPALPIRAQPSFLTLTLLPDRAILAGQLAEEANRTQLIEAARRAYSPRAVVLAESLLARGTCEPTPEIQQTLRSLPPLPKLGQPVVFAFARPGEVWKSLPVTPAMLEPGGIEQASLLPSDFPAPMAEDTFAEAFDYVRAAWAKQTSAPASAQPPR
ncbi:MAG TPA: BON domain-containing protein [Prosthecobacter sp.]|nr:BON domain-containing protein [Prosthecobacter sp.]